MPGKSQSCSRSAVFLHLIGGSRETDHGGRLIEAQLSEKKMNKVRFETSDALGVLSLANPPLNLFDEELIEDLRTAVNQARQLPLRALLVRADGKVFSGGANVAIFKEKTAKDARERFSSHLRTIADIEE